MPKSDFVINKQTKQKIPVKLKKASLPFYRIFAIGEFGNMDDLQMKVANKIPDVLIADKSGTT
jgi:hypothetical protein